MLPSASWQFCWHMQTILHRYASICKLTILLTHADNFACVCFHLQADNFADTCRQFCLGMFQSTSWQFCWHMQTILFGYASICKLTILLTHADNFACVCFHLQADKFCWHMQTVLFGYASICKLTILLTHADNFAWVCFHLQADNFADTCRQFCLGMLPSASWQYC